MAIAYIGGMHYMHSAIQPHSISYRKHRHPVYAHGTLYAQLYADRRG